MMTACSPVHVSFPKSGSLGLDCIGDPANNASCTSAQHPQHDEAKLEAGETCWTLTGGGSAVSTVGGPTASSYLMQAYVGQAPADFYSQYYCPAAQSAVPPHSQVYFDPTAAAASPYQTVYADYQQQHQDPFQHQLQHHNQFGDFSVRSAEHQMFLPSTYQVQQQQQQHHHHHHQHFVQTMQPTIVVEQFKEVDVDARAGCSSSSSTSSSGSSGGSSGRSCATGHSASTQQHTGRHVCDVCGDTAAGFHCGAFVCEACKKFFIRSSRAEQQQQLLLLYHGDSGVGAAAGGGGGSSSATVKYACSKSGSCEITKETRTHCQFCRYKKCLALQMFPPGKNPTIVESISEIPCRVCGASSSGFHFGAITCEGCKGFFRRTIKERDSGKYVCSKGGSCEINKSSRNACKSCRFTKCIQAGMSSEGSRIGRQPNAVKHLCAQEIQAIKTKRRRLVVANFDDSKKQQEFLQQQTASYHHWTSSSQHPQPHQRSSCHDLSGASDSPGEMPEPLDKDRSGCQSAKSLAQDQQEVQFRLVVAVGFEVLCNTLSSTAGWNSLAATNAVARFLETVSGGCASDAEAAMHCSTGAAFSAAMCAQKTGGEMPQVTTWPAELADRAMRLMKRLNEAGFDRVEMGLLCAALAAAGDDSQSGQFQHQQPQHHNSIVARALACLQTYQTEKYGSDRSGMVEWTRNLQRHLADFSEELSALSSDRLFSID